MKNSKSTAALYEELRAITDGGSESMTHADAVIQLRTWERAHQQAVIDPTLRIATALERIATSLEQISDLAFDASQAG